MNQTRIVNKDACALALSLQNRPKTVLGLKS